MRASRPLRLLRAGAAATVATLAALLSHLAGGGQLPGLLGVVVPWVLSLAVCLVLAGRSLSLVRLSLAVVVSQALFHLLFVVGTVTPSGASPAHHHGELLLLATGSVPAEVGMSAAHLGAAAVTTAALYRGERAMARLFAVARAVGMWLRQALRRPRPVPVSGRGPRGIGAFGVQTPAPRWFGGSVRRRGPPRVATV